MEVTMITIKAESKVYCDLRHPLYDDVRLSATVIDGWHKNGRFIGLELQFTDGHTCCMTFDEIREAQKDDDNE